MNTFNQVQSLQYLNCTTVEGAGDSGGITELNQVAGMVSWWLL